MRIRHITSIDQLLHAGADIVALEYLSVVGATEHEFRDAAERDRYVSLVRAWGQFAHAEHFAAATDAQDPVQPVCRDCGSESLVRDASARWDEQSQDWTISGVYDSTY